MTLDNYFNLGIDHYERGELDDALICFKKCIELDPKDSLSYNNVGLMYYSLHKFNESIFYFNNAIEIEPDSFDAYFNRGLANIQLNLNTDAFNDFKFLSINCPDYPGLSEQLEEIQNIESFHSMTYSSSRLLIDYGKNPDGAFKMGQIAEKNNDYLSAIKDYTVAINNKEGFAEALIARGRCYEKIKNYSSAVLDYIESEKYLTSKSNTIQKIAGLYFNLKDYNNALNYYNLLISDNSSNAQNYFGRALVKIKLNLSESAFFDLTKCIEIDHKNVDAISERAKLRSEFGDLSGAINDFSTIINILDPNDGYNFYNRGVAYFKNNQIEDALRDLKKAENFGETEATNVIKIILDSLI